MASQRRRLILFARYPLAGRVKTRLIPALGAEGAAALHRRLMLRTLRTAGGAGRAANAELEIRFEGGSEHAMQHWLGDGRRYCRQGDGDLGDRMARALEDSVREGSSSTVIIGSDCPALTSDLITAAFERLSETPAVFGPANDGGYYLIGLSRLMPDLFRRRQWGTETVLAESIGVLEQAGIQPALLPPLDDLDRPEDLPVWHRITEPEEADLSRVSVIIPALNEGESVAASIESAREGKPCEIILVDGGSTDDSVRRAREAGAAVLRSAPGRAQQMNAGAAHAAGTALLFLHADSVLPRDFVSPVSETLRPMAVACGAFQFKTDARIRGKWILERAVNLRSRWRQMPYGDQALFMRRSLFEELGGFADLPIMEDYELVCRLRQRGRVVMVNQKVLTSGRRWQSLGLFQTTLLNWWITWNFRRGCPPQQLAGLYKRALRR